MVMTADSLEAPAGLGLAGGSDGARRLATDDPVARELTRARLFGGRPPRIGRYEVRRILGSGGMGVVYAVHDAELDREVALKMLSGTGGAQREARLQREARALARLSHPNVVQVFDFGRAFGRFFLTMELVDGLTMRQWQRGRSVDEIVEAYAHAGHGIAAAHAAGLLHRDLKPDNILIGRDARVRVVDFGLVADGPTEELEAQPPVVPGAGQTGPGTALAGTPAYMSPEQLDRAPLDPRSDVFSFCVALFEGLAGALPFAGTTLEARAHDLIAGRVAWSRLPATLPRWLRGVLATGLAAAPEHRFASMDALLLALERRPRRRLRTLAAATAVMVGLGAWSLRDGPPDERCAALPEVAAAWNDATAARLAAGFVRAQPSYGASAWTAVVPQIEHYADAYRGARDRVCVTGATAGDDAAIACLVRAHDRFAAALASFAGAEPNAVEHANAVLAELPLPDACTAAGTAALDRGTHEAAHQLDRRIASLRDRVDDGETAALEEEARQLLADALAQADPGVRARAWLMRASLLHRQARNVEAVSALEDAYFIASEAGLADETVQAAAILVGACGFDLGDPQRGLEWAKHAEGALARMGLQPRGVWQLRHARIAVLTDANRLDEAEADVRDAIATLEAMDPLRAGVDLENLYGDLGGVMLARGRLPEAQAAFEQALALGRRLHGAEHPILGTALIGLATALDEQGQATAAQQHLREAARLFTNAYGADSPKLAPVLNNLANSITDPARAAEALALAAEALRIAELTGMAPARIAELHHTVGNLHQRLGELDAAATQYERERMAIESSLGSDHPDLGHPLHSLGRVEVARGHFAAARRLFEGALTLWRASYGDDHPLVAFPLSSLGELSLREQEPAAAVAPLREALALRTRHAGEPAKLANTQFALARALWDGGGDRSEALALARQARDGYVGVGVAELEHLRELDAWLLAHRAG